MLFLLSGCQQNNIDTEHNLTDCDRFKNIIIRKADFLKGNLEADSTFIRRRISLIKRFIKAYDSYNIENSNIKDTIITYKKLYFNYSDPKDSLLLFKSEYEAKLALCANLLEMIEYMDTKYLDGRFVVTYIHPISKKVGDSTFIYIAGCEYNYNNLSLVQAIYDSINKKLTSEDDTSLIYRINKGIVSFKQADLKRPNELTVKLRSEGGFHYYPVNLTN